MQNKELKLPEDPYEDLGFLFWQIMKTWQRGKQKLVDEFGITASQLEILSSIYHLSCEEKEVTQIAISNLINVDPMTTSTVLRNLEKKGLVKRKPSKIDTRARIVELTDKGEDLFIKAISKVKEANERLLKLVDGDLMKKQLKILLDVLNEEDI